MAEIKKIKLAERRHPLFEENLPLWELYQSAVLGGDDFINDSNLFSHRLEESEDFEERLERAFFLNFCSTIPTIYNFYIFKEKIGRSADPLLERFRRDIDRRNTDITDFIRRVGFLSSIYGVMHVLVDVPPAGGRILTKAEDKEIYPYCSLIFPQDLVDWSLDAYSNYNWVIIKSTYYRDEDPTVERSTETHYKLITKTEWRVEDEDGNIVKFEDGSPSSGTNELGIIPIATIYHQDINSDKIGESMLKDIVYINRAILNWCSCIDEQIERQTFSQLVVPDNGELAEEDETGSGDPLYKIGTSSIWTFPSDSANPPQFISPNVGNISTIWNLVVDHIKEIFRMAGLVGSSQDLYVSQSGRAAQMGFMGVNSALADKAKKYQKLENDISRLAYLQLGKNPDDFEEVKYPDTFDVGTLSDELDSYFRVMRADFSETLNKQLMKNIARRAVPLAPPVVRATIEKEIEAGDGKISNVSSTEPEGQVGNPNVDQLADVYKTTQQKKKEQTSHRIEKSSM